MLAAILDNDPYKVEVFLAGLERLVGAAVTPTRLRALVPDGREYLAFAQLEAVGAVRLQGGAARRRLESGGIAWLADHLHVYLEAMAASPDLTRHDEPELAWTLPAGIMITGGPPPRSLAALMSSVISDAQSRLFLLSPFLDPRGAESLVGAVAGAAQRGALIHLISRGLDEPDSSTAAALRVFREAVPDIRAYTAPRTEPGSPYLLLHAKVITADGRRAVMASANLTHYGLETHLEVGLGVSGRLAADLETLMVAVVESDTVRQLR